MQYEYKNVNYDLLSEDDKLLFLQKASDLLANGKQQEAISMCKCIPLSPLMVRYLTILYGKEYIKEQGYMIRGESEIEN